MEKKQQTTNRAISALVRYGLAKGLLQEEDKVYAINRLLSVMGLAEFDWQETGEPARTPAELLETLCDYAAHSGRLTAVTGQEADSRDARDEFDTELMNCLMPRPSEVAARFYALYEKDRKAATEYYYELSKNSNYIRVDRVEKDKLWTSPTPYGDLVITINLSKPEKDPKAIAAARNAPQSGYPKCALCRENEGYQGSLNQAPRANHRLLPLTLCGEKWFLQYSPYVYYNEHCIVLSEEHRPMKVDRASFEHLLEFVTVLPHYFVGSNADLPIVGGSILTHDHFQGGNFEFPMAKAELREEVRFADFPGVHAGIVRWPMSVLRLRSSNREELTELADRILIKWRSYSDESADILAVTAGASEEENSDTPHNTITPIARRRGEDYELDLVLRNNRTTAEHPLGLFHPHAEYHHIKKENIGLIEVMGLAILPPRLLEETGRLEEALAWPEKEAEIMARPEMEKHRDWLVALKRQPGKEVSLLVRNDIGRIFGEILGNAGVYKDTPAGREAFRRFCESI